MKKTNIKVYLGGIVIIVSLALAMLLQSTLGTFETESKKDSETMSSLLGSTGTHFSGKKFHTFVPCDDSYLSFPVSDITDLDVKANKINTAFPLPAMIGSGPESTSGNKSNDRAAKVCKQKQWAVVTTIHVPNLSIIGVSKLCQWCLVIVGDTITPDNAYENLASKDNIFYLSASYQKNILLKRGNLGAKIRFMNMMPFKSFARKMLGTYLR